MSVTRKYSLTLFGATGFTGGLCADYLGQHIPVGTQWAIAGRNEQKLQDVCDRLKDGGCQTLPSIVVADVSDADSLESMAADSKVVITTVGPYVQYGEALARSCAAKGTHYCDLTGEPEFVNNMISRYHDLAKSQGAALVNCCGFDSIPHDAGVLLTVRALEKALGKPLSSRVDVEGVVTANGTFSGGTWQSAITAFGRPKQNKLAMQQAKKALDNLFPKKARALPMRTFHDKEFGRWLCPMPTIDPYIVIRSARAIDSYGPDFHYGHYAGIKSLPKMLGGIAGIGGLLLASQVGFIRNKLLTFKQSGDGPAKEQRARSWFKVTFRGRSEGTQVMTRVSGGDPGYDETAKMLAETAMALAFDKGYPKQTGVITPIMALEDRMIERLQTAGMTFEVL
ncbi:MAG: saccharopine dehydrogenase NADP-binding domain-containing protein [Gammaproteobacteria bacterium]|jgi:short subunit dehydrogenase-like uncharacterized protein|nr:saccharopine dehydrogenase NADP-binding domain-containing protein [Gammaproteobacteria bacterium]MBQ0774049.1 saccharopine dehydrogenase NADP-binding domain-containing protein [Gammaproteobacteria bacterium]|tara:strand:+ start:95238 stop:96425 length:1188 start_codon:yes stop_codon:yes gene_type:complete